MGFLFRFVGCLIVRSSGKRDSALRSAAAVESLERRVLFDVQINSPLLDAPGTISSSVPPVILADQAETTNVTFSPPGSNDRTVAAYNDSAIAQFGQVSGSPTHRTGWAYSDDGGNSFVQPNNNPTNPVLLPTVSDGTEMTGDEANHSLAWDNVNATLYLADTSWPNHSDINVYASTDGGQTFTEVMDATPGAPTGSSNNITYDKPWVAVDNNPDSPNYGTVYLAYVQNINNSQNQILITYLAPGSRSWLPYSGEFPLASGLVQSPEVLVEPGGSVDVVYVGPDSTGLGIFLEHSGSPTRQQGWTTTPTELTHYNDVQPSSWSVAPYSVGPDSTYPTIAHILVYPSTAIITIGTDTYLYGAYTDATQVGEGPDVTLGVYTFQYDLTNPGMVGSPNSPIGAISTEADEWQPSLTFSPDGAYAFIGFYGGTGVYDQNAHTSDEQYNMFYVTAQVRADGINWSAPTQITNVDASSGQPTGGYFDQPGGPLQDIGLGGSFPRLWSPDYDGASADYQSFHYSFMETKNEEVTDPATRSAVNLTAQEDVHMASIPIPYTGDPAPAVPTGVAAARGTYDDEPTLTIAWDDTHTHYDDEAKIYVEYSSAGQGWQPLGNSFAWATNGSEEFFAVNSGGIPILNYSPNTTYYFRARAVESTPGSAISPWSAVYVAPGSNTMLFTGTGGSDTINLIMDSSGNSIDFTLNNVQTTVPIISGGSILVLGMGGDDTITFDLSNGNFLAGSNTIDNGGGTLKLDIVGTTSNDTVNIVGGGNAPYTFDTTNINVVAGLVESLEYDDGGGNGTTTETLGVTGMIPVMLNLSSGDSTNTITNSDSAPVFIVPGTGKITLNATAGATIFPASTATTGIRQINFAALNISAGAYVALADSSATFDDFSNHANRSVAIIDAGGLNIASGGTLDMGDNDMILRYAPANEAATETSVFNLLQSGITPAGDWSGTGISSSEANFDSDFGIGARAVGFMDNNDVQDSSFDGVNLSDFNQVMIKFTYYGDADLSGTFDATDINQLIAGRSDTPGNTGWEFCDLDYDGTTSTAQDQTLYFAGRSAYQHYGAL